jgi:hypothetical protein
MGFGFLSLFGGNSFNGLWFIFIGFFINSSSETGLSQTIIIKSDHHKGCIRGDAYSGYDDSGGSLSWTRRIHSEINR